MCTCGLKTKKYNLVRNTIHNTELLVKRIQLFSMYYFLFAIQFKEDYKIQFKNVFSLLASSECIYEGKKDDYLAFALNKIHCT